MRTTIKDIAAKTNLSVTTVSLVLNNKPSKISKETKQLVLKTARELHYRPNQLAVGLVKKRTKTIGLIVSDIRNSFFSSLAKGVEDECQKNGWTVILCNTNDLHERDLEYINVLSSKGVDGIVYCMSRDSSPEKFQESYRLLHSLNLPVVMLDRFYEIPGVSVIKVDHVKGGYLAASHLLELGHRRIACITGPQHLQDSQDRLRGYQKALEAWNIPYDNTLVTEGNYDTPSGASGIEKMMGRNFTAVFAFNDLMAYGVYQGLKRHGLSIPDDVSVVGYDDIFASEILEVPLTTIRQPTHSAGAGAASKLIAMIENQTSPGSVQTFLPELTVRKSTCPPRICPPNRIDETEPTI